MRNSRREKGLLQSLAVPFEFFNDLCWFFLVSGENDSWLIRRRRSGIWVRRQIGSGRAIISGLVIHGGRHLRVGIAAGRAVVRGRHEGGGGRGGGDSALLLSMAIGF